MRSRIQLAGLALLAALALAQTSDQPIIRVGTRLVQINVIVHDKNGPVADLKKEDFTLLDKGKPRDITVFHVDTRLSDEEKFRKATKFPPNVFSNSQADAANTSIVLFDGLNTKITDQMYAKQQIVKFLGQLKPDDRVGIYTLGRTVRVLHEFTTDTSSLLAAIKRFKGDLSGQVEASTVDPSNSGSDDLDQFLDSSNQRIADAAVRNRVLTTVDAMKAIAGHVEHMAGRKNLVWVSGAFPISIGFDEPMKIGDTRDRLQFTEEIEEAARALMKANVAVYPVDARGLMIDPAFSAEAPSVSMRRPAAPKLPIGFQDHSTMEMIATRTGGKAFYNTNDIMGSVRRAIDDSEVSYTLGFYLSQDEMDSRFHEIKVKVDRKGVDIRARKGFLAYKDQEAAAIPQTKRDQLVREAINAPLDATGLTMAFRLDRADQVKAGSVQATAFVDPKAFVFEQKGGKFTDIIEVVFAQQAADGRILDTLTQTVNMKFTPERYKDVLTRAIELTKIIDPKPGATFVRVVVLDHGSGQIGSLRGQLGWIMSQPPQPPAPPPAKKPA